ncbi:MAG: FadR family transcriptional regulator [Desulfobacterales bacterium]|nr:FadR family transcriptional regulator [Desulfobacterales bacterium]
MEPIFNKIKLQKLTDEIADQLRTLIMDGKLSPGEKLPAERSLAEMLGVGRSSLREALNILQAQGFVETRKRRGIFVCSLGASIVSDPLQQVLEEDKDKLLQLYEIRKELEIATAAKSALQRRQTDLDQMKAVLDAMAEDAKETRLALERDLEFHQLIARSTGNFFRSHILKSIFDLSDAYLKFVVKHIVNDRDHIDSVLAQHRRILDAIEARNPDEAGQAMADHLTFVEEQWKSYVVS